MTHNNNNTSIFQQPILAACFALIAAIAWGWAYPLIKMGMTEFAISKTMTGGKMLFAGIRFFVSGIIILVIAYFTKRKFRIRKRTDWGFIFLYSIINTTMHYAFFYFGLSHCEGARAAILNSLSVFCVVIFACMFFKSDRMTKNKLLGCVLGFTGIMALNIGNGIGEQFTWLGDGMIILNALCGATASLMARGFNKRIDVFVGTGYSLAFGGLMLILIGKGANGFLPQTTPFGLLLLFLLVCISTIGFSLYNKLLSCNPVGKIAIYNSLIPVVGAITSCLCLGETFYWKYILAGVLSVSGIHIINKEKK